MNKNSQKPKYQLLSKEGLPYKSTKPGKFGGHKGLKIYGKLDCPSALRWIAKGYYVKQRVFFANESDAKQAGYRPCKICMKKEKT